MKSLGPNSATQKKRKLIITVSITTNDNPSVQFNIYLPFFLFSECIPPKCLKLCPKVTCYHEFLYVIIDFIKSYIYFFLSHFISWGVDSMLFFKMQNIYIM